MQGVRLIQLPKIPDERGNLSFLENDNQIPFSMARAYWIYDVPAGEIRGGHAFKMQEEVIIALSGSFDVVLKNGKEEMKFALNRSYNALYVPRMIWRHIENFSTNSLALIATNAIYDEKEYIRDYDEYLKLKA